MLSIYTNKTKKKLVSRNICNRLSDYLKLAHSNIVNSNKAFLLDSDSISNVKYNASSLR